MKLRFHPAVQRDINEVLEYYSERSPIAADRFWDELQTRFHEIAGNPERFGFLNQPRGLRRARLKKFPYVIIFYKTAQGAKITCVKHEHRHPNTGIFRR